LIFLVCFFKWVNSTYRYAEAIWNAPEVKKVKTVIGGWTWYWKRTRRCPARKDEMEMMPRMYKVVNDPAAAAANTESAPECAICDEVRRDRVSCF
jgi:hypothetical protein